MTIVADIEAMAQAMFNAYHSAANRVRSWVTHPIEDSGAELGKKTFATMAKAAAGVVAKADAAAAPLQANAATLMGTTPAVVASLVATVEHDAADLPVKP